MPEGWAGVIAPSTWDLRRLGLPRGRASVTAWEMYVNSLQTLLFLQKNQKFQFGYQGSRIWVQVQCDKMENLPDSSERELLRGPSPSAHFCQDRLAGGSHGEVKRNTHMQKIRYLCTSTFIFFFIQGHKSNS